MRKPIQFSVTRLEDNLYHIVVQDEKEILRSYDVQADSVMINLGSEVGQLKSQGKSAL